MPADAKHAEECIKVWLVLYDNNYSITFYNIGVWFFAGGGLRISLDWPWEEEMSWEGSFAYIYGWYTGILLADVVLCRLNIGFP